MNIQLKIDGLTVYSADVLGTNPPPATTPVPTTPAPTPAPAPIPAGAPEPVIPSTAKVVDLLPAVTPWKMNHDAGTPGSSVGTTQYPFTAPDGSIVRLFDFTDTAHGGEIYHVNFAEDLTGYRHFCYEAVEASHDWSNIACAEKDLEKVGPDGKVYDMADQQSGYSGTAETTDNNHWTATKIKADPSKRLPNVLHTTRLYVDANDDGTITYNGQFYDGTYNAINVTTHDTQHSLWRPNIGNIQLQYDGKSSGSVRSQVLMYKLRVYYW